MTKVFLYSDGSAKATPGPGGFVTILRYTDPSGQVHEKEFSCGYEKTTNNRMELLGVITGLELLKFSCDVTVISDSKYVVDAFNQHWVESWQKNGFRKSDRKPVKNMDLWKRLLEDTGRHKVTFEWVKGHEGHPENERCDKLATTAADGENLLIDEGFNDSQI